MNENIKQLIVDDNEYIQFEGQTWEVINATSNIWKPKKKGEFIQGQVTQKSTGVYGLQLTLSGDQGDLITPSHKALIGQLELVKLGDFIRIEFIGQEIPTKKGQSGIMIYRVLRFIK